jgi:hypothetical protein
MEMPKMHLKTLVKTIAISQDGKEYPTLLQLAKMTTAKIILAIVEEGG